MNAKLHVTVFLPVANHLVARAGWELKVESGWPSADSRVNDFSNLAHHHPPWQEEGEEPPAFFSSSSFLDSNQGKGWLKSGWTSNETSTKEQKRCANPCNNQSRVESLSSSNLKKNHPHCWLLELKLKLKLKIKRKLKPKLKIIFRLSSHFYHSQVSKSKAVKQSIFQDIFAEKDKSLKNCWCATQQHTLLCPTAPSMQL